MGLQFNLIKTMTRQGLKNGILYTYDAEQEAAQDAEEEKVSKEMKTAQDALAAEEARKASIKAAAALTAAGIDKKTYENKLVFLMTVDKARFRNPVIPDCRLELNIEAVRSHGRVWKYKGEAFVDGRKMADAQWAATIVDRKK